MIVHTVLVCFRNGTASLSYTQLLDGLDDKDIKNCTRGCHRPGVPGTGNVSAFRVGFVYPTPSAASLALELLAIPCADLDDANRTITRLEALGLQNLPGFVGLLIEVMDVNPVPDASV